MNRNGIWVIVVILAVLLVLFATDTLSLDCDAGESNFSESLEDAGEDIEDAVDELGGN